MEQNRPRKMWLAALLSVLAPGLGHIYAGKARKGIFLYILQFAFLTVVLAAILISPNIYSLAFALLISIGYIFFCVVDAIRTAKSRASSYTLKRYNRWYVYVLCYIVVACIPTVHLIKNHIVKAYNIPAGSMLPTIQIGDDIFVNRLTYKFYAPKPGDLVVFPLPQKPKIEFLKRIVAVGGDKVKIRNKKLYVNGVEEKGPYVEYTDNRILKEKTSPRDNLGPVTVPRGSVFVIGDNRDNSYDSRFFGFINQDQIQGKAMIVYWSWDKRDKKVRWGRIGKKLE
jgi:signal peptidase I